MSVHHPPGDLPARWRAKAADLRAFRPSDPIANALEFTADELERALKDHANALLNLTEAAAESGYSPDHVGRLLRDHPTLNRGRKHSPRIRRGDLQKKLPTAVVAGLANVAAAEEIDAKLFRDIAHSKRAR
ncbi:MAG: hypothetical protein M3418_11010 [Gemmatimonadota bacterium]|jgi:hypothetical protein|nr:hypothetical protein [Gemmatimonadota bacterium]